MKSALHVIIVIALTLVSQVGGIIWVIVFGFFAIKKKNVSFLIKLLTFILVYTASTLLIIPHLAKLGGRVALPISKSGTLIPHTYITPFLNRHYVTHDLKTELLDIASQINSSDSQLKVSYLDANFPFIDGFPLLPHLSHSDGKKIDLSFYYTKGNQVTNKKPSRTGYGHYEDPLPSEFNQTEKCKSNGYWQYDFTKYLTLGTRDDLVFDEKMTKQLVLSIINKPLTHKLLIEPHLKARLRLKHDKVRFQGCHAVRHDDHIHYQIH